MSSAFGAVRQLQLIHRGEIVIRVAVLNVADPLEHRVEHG